MYKDYLDAIIRHYEFQRREGLLPPPLLKPTPATLRDLCVFVYNERFEKRDMINLKGFFEMPGDGDLPKVIRKFGTDKFKPLVNFLKGETIDTDAKNIELLGWLVDFSNRPFNRDFDYEGGQADGPVAVLPQPEVLRAEPIPESKASLLDTPPEPHVGHERKEIAVSSNTKRRRRILLMALGIMAVGISTYFIYQGTKETSFIGIGQKACMIWTGDHYQSIACDSLPSRGLAQGLDSMALINCRRITRPDTISEKDIGKIWYQKRGRDSVEYYTGGGRDPLNPNRDLHRFTRYMYNRYVKRGLD